jgi:c-di-GMP-binding flagellar brake protein YcgR
MPGITVRLDVSSGGEGETHVTRVEDVEDQIAILVPMRGLRPRPFTTGTLIHAHYVHQQKRWMFVTEVAGHSPDGMYEYLRMPATIESTDRRLNFRLPVAIRPESLCRINVDTDAEPQEHDLLDGTLVDLSEGGCCISTRNSAMPGERLGILAILPEAGQIEARMRVNTVRDPERGNRNRRLHCQFTEISRADRDVIARYMMRRQLEMRRRGQL